MSLAAHPERPGKHARVLAALRLGLRRGRCRSSEWDPRTPGRPRPSWRAGARPPRLSRHGPRGSAGHARARVARSRGTCRTPCPGAAPAASEKREHERDAKYPDAQPAHRVTAAERRLTNRRLAALGGHPPRVRLPATVPRGRHHRRGAGPSACQAGDPALIPHRRGSCALGRAGRGSGLGPRWPRARGPWASGPARD